MVIDIPVQNPLPSAMDAPIPVSDANEKITFFIFVSKKYRVSELRFNISFRNVTQFWQVQKI